MKFKRLRVFKGDTLNFDIPVKEFVHNVPRAHVLKGNGTPIGRFEVLNENNVLKCRLSHDVTMRLQGTYKYEIAYASNNGIATAQYGILEVM
ncbi:hypothetical protein V4F87_003251 [Vibrio parahaemolyticus]|nr:hypothetical protein [Vibrio parahaemolyticus]